MKRIPILATIIVALAVAAMIGLGLWQLLDRRPQKEAFLRQLATNPARPPIAWPLVPGEALLFRRSGAVCLPPITQRLAGAGSSGYRVLATCRIGAAGTGLVVQLGTTRDPNARVTWAGGPISGFIAHQPDGRSLIAGLFDRTPPGLLLVADRPAPGLQPNKPADIASVPNNHLAYAGQWFAFAGIAAVIYALALRRRAR